MKPRIAVAQIPMHWELAANVQAMKHAMQLARAQGAGLCAFAELALTGFHRRIVEWAKPELVGPAVAEVQAAAASLGPAVAFGAPTFTGLGGGLSGETLVGRLAGPPRAASASTATCSSVAPGPWPAWCPKSASPRPRPRSSRPGWAGRWLGSR
ncbi:MAG: hypothetical protein JNN03_24005 [Rubrivivax sp.]|nr:hypothetical protein [Rubrivivax sp.]